MLTNELPRGWWVGVSTSDAFEVMFIIFKDFAWDTLNLSLNLISIKSVTFYCQNLTSCSIALYSINTVYSSHSLSFVARSVLIAASDHRVIHVLGIANTEPKINFGWCVRSNGSHSSTNLIFCIARKDCIFFNESLEVHSIAIDTDLNPWKLR